MAKLSGSVISMSAEKRVLVRVASRADRSSRRQSSRH